MLVWVFEHSYSLPVDWVLLLPSQSGLTLCLFGRVSLQFYWFYLFFIQVLVAMVPWGQTFHQYNQNKKIYIYFFSYKTHTHTSLIQRGWVKCGRHILDKCISLSPHQSSTRLFTWWTFQQFDPQYSLGHLLSCTNGPWKRSVEMNTVVVWGR
jgi:hypothetical protein